MLTELRKALTSSGDGDALNLDDIEMMLHEELLLMQPLAQILDVKQAEGKTHEYRVRSSHPMAWFEAENSAVNNKNSVYARKTVQLKIQRIWGEVTGFSRAVTAKFIDNLEAELEGSLQGMADLFEFAALYGASSDVSFTGDALQYSGLLARVFSYAPANVIDAGGDKVTLADLDGAIAKARRHRQVRRDPYIWMLSQEMKQVVDGLQTKVQIPLTSVTLADGAIEMDAYSRIPLFETEYVKPEAATTSPTAAAGTPTAGGAVPDGTYQYRISSVTAYGEQVGGTASGNAVCGTGDNTVPLTWTADTTALNYMIWRRPNSGDYDLIDIIPAQTYDANGIPNGDVEAYTDAGAKSPITTVHPLEAGEEQIVLFNYNVDRGAAYVGMVDDMGDPIGRLISFVDLARTKDAYSYMLKSYSALRLVHPNLVSVIRHVKLA